MAELPPGALRVRAALAAQGFAAEIVIFPDSTRTAAEAAAAIGCTIAQIAKSLVFRARDTARPVLIVASGIHRVDERKVAGALGEPVTRADAEFVRTMTGYAIGGVPPIAHATPAVVFVDAGLASRDPVWAAAGTPHAVFRTSFADLVRMTAGRVIDLAA